MNKKIDCPGCGHKKEVSEQEIEHLIADQLLLEVELVPDSIRDRRLSICSECAMLLKYTCLKCGCFAKFRASLLHKNCPMNKW